MTVVLAYPIAFGATLVTTLAVLGLWVAHARIIDGHAPQTVFLSFVFLFVSLVFFVSAFSNIVAVALGQLVALGAPALGRWVTIGAAGVLVWFSCAWSQRGIGALRQGPRPLSTVPVALFCLTDMLILAGGLSLLPAV